MKAQGSTEYLVIFSAVLIVALIVIMLLADFGSLGDKARLDQSKAYWRSAFPIQILDAKYAIQWGGTMYLLVKNVDMKPIWIEQWGIYFNNYPAGVGPITPVRLDPGKEVGIIVWPPTSIFGSCPVGQTFSFDVKIYYNYGDGNRKIQVGTYPLVGHCVYYW